MKLAHKNSLVPVFYADTHNLHQPLYEYDRGLQIPYQEIPRRIEAAKAALCALPFTKLINPSRRLTEAFCLNLHAAALIDYLKRSSIQAAKLQQEHPDQGEVYLTPWIYPLKPAMASGLRNSPEAMGCFAFDLYAPVGEHSWEAVFASANLAFTAADAVLRGETQIAYALCRPPGHHAGYDYTGGYCYLNNAAIAAESLLPLGAGAILDIDYHHGNGTQEIFWERADVLYVSIHADPRAEYPFYSGFAEERGGKAAFDKNLNLPLPMGSGDTVYLHALDKALAAIQNMEAQWLVLSAGYDTCHEDPTTTFTLTDAVYAEIGKRIAKLQIPVVIVHEGGYAVEANGRLAAQLLSGLFLN